MIFIRKFAEPAAFKLWKSQNPAAAYKEMPAPVKTSLQKALLSEQGYICCFCGTRIGQVDEKTGAVTPATPGERPHSKACRLDHIKPQSRYRDQALDYFNICCSCPARESERHCDRAKEDKELKISPLDAGCEKYFQYYMDGAIGPAASLSAAAREDARDTITTLNLNAGRLTTRRKNAIQGIFEALSKNETNREKIIENFSSKDAEGRYQEYFFVVLSYFR